MQFYTLVICCGGLNCMGQGSLFLVAVPQQGPEGSLHSSGHPVRLFMQGMKVDCLSWWGVRPVWCVGILVQRAEEMQGAEAAGQGRGWVLAGCSWGCRALPAPFICSAWDVLSPGTYLPSSWSAWGNCLLLVVAIPFDQGLCSFSSVCGGLISTSLTKVYRSW